MSDKERCLADIVTLQRGKTYKSKLLKLPGPVLLGLASIARNGGFRDDNLKTYGGDSPDNLLVKPGELYVSLKDVTQSGDLLGAVARLPDSIPLGRLTQDTVKLNLDTVSPPTSYLYWLLRTPQYREHCRGHATGTTNLGLAREDFLAFPVPPINRVRDLIFHALDDIEDKIEQNRRTAGVLERLARAIFRAWFVDFEPVHAKATGATHFPAMPQPLFDQLPTTFQDAPGTNLGPIPQGWEVKTLGDLATQVRVAAKPDDIDPDTHYIGLEHMPRRCFALNEWEAVSKVTSNKSRFEAGQILFGKLRPYFHKVGVAPVDGVCSTDIVVLQPKEADLFGPVLGLVTSDAFVDHTTACSSGTKMPRTNWKDMSRYEVAIGPDAVAKAFTELVRPMTDHVIAGIHESRKLAELRDYLLPKLLSGAVRVRTENDTGSKHA